jgi:hypothetical protein
MRRREGRNALRLPHREDPRDPWGEDLYRPSPAEAMASIEVEVSHNPIVAELLGPDGEVIRRWRERPPIGFQRRTT